MKCRLHVAILWATACSVAGCGGDLRGVELPYLQCVDGIDNDGDGLIDCKDPDCWSVACVEDDAGRDAGINDGGEIEDAGADTSTDPVDSGHDAAVDPCAQCAVEEICIDDTCRLQLPASVRIEAIAMDGPSRTASLLPFEQFYLCLDGPGLGPSDDCPEYACDMCPPDPYIRVDIERVGSNGIEVRTVVGKTHPASNTESASWPNDATRWAEDRNPVQIKPGDQVLLRVFDDDSEDPNGADDFVYGCAIKAADLHMGRQQCISKRSGVPQSAKEEFVIEIDVRPP